MTAKMLTRQAGKAHKEADVQKAKVKKVCMHHDRFPESRLFNREILILQEFMLGMRSGRSRNVSTYFVCLHVLMQLPLV